MSHLFRMTLAWGVHFYTATGAVAAMAALVAAATGDTRWVFIWLAVALAVDATDGALARLVGVKKLIPHYDGAHLDDIIDFQTFVTVPIFFMLQAGLLEGQLGLVAAAAALLASAYRFCHSDAKTPDHFFTGFPSYWNIVALYLYVFDDPAAWNANIILALAFVVFLPLRFLYPSRTVPLRQWSVGLGILWALLLTIVILSLPERRWILATISLFYPVYYIGASLFLQFHPSGKALCAATGDAEFGDPLRPRPLLRGSS